MAIRPTRKKGEASSTVSISLRVSPKAKFALVQIVDEILVFQHVLGGEVLAKGAIAGMRI